MSESTTGDANGWDEAADLLMSDAQRQEVERGLRFAHVMMSVNQAQGTEAIVAAEALTGLLMQKGVVSEDEVKTAREQARQEVEKIFQPRVRLGDLGDKYAESETVEIDCANRIHLCHARCCTFAFYLSAQDLDEGVARWDYGNPYWIKHDTSGYCVHCDKGSLSCTIHAKRPHVCRMYDCRQDKRVWLDFEQRIPAPMEPPTPPLPTAMAEFRVVDRAAEANAAAAARRLEAKDSDPSPAESTAGQ